MMQLLPAEAFATAGVAPGSVSILLLRRRLIWRIKKEQGRKQSAVFYWRFFLESKGE